MESLGDRLVEGVLSSAIPQAVEKCEHPEIAEVASAATDTEPESARQIGGWHIPESES